MSPILLLLVLFVGEINSLAAALYLCILHLYSESTGSIVHVIVMFSPFTHIIRVVDSKLSIAKALIIYGIGKELFD